MKRVEGGLRIRGSIRSNCSGETLVSVVTVVKNGAGNLQQTIDSVLGQTWPNLEYIVIDGGSTDGTLDIIKHYEGQIDYWISEPDRGIYDAMNKGIALATGDLIGLLNADDWYELEAVATAAKTFARKQVCGVYYGDRFIVQDDFSHEFELRASFDIWRGMTIGHQSMFVHREVYKQLGAYTLDYRLAGDFDFFVRAVLAKVAFVPLDCVIVHFRDSGASAQNATLGLKEIRNVIKVNYGGASPEYLKNLLASCYHLFVLRIKRLIRFVLGEQALLRLRAIYGRVIILRGKKIKKF